MPAINDTPLPAFQPPKRWIVNLFGLRFGRLLVVGLAGTIKYVTYWYCLCKCGGLCYVAMNKLRRGETISCGCFATETKSRVHRKHGMHNSRTYKSWACMLERTRNPNNIAYHNYGGRGITVCDEWLKFENFFADMGVCPQGYTIERINNDGNYCPENCKWDTYSNQAKNKRTSKTFEYQGRKQSSAAWAREFGMSRSCLKLRLESGMSIHNALTWPLHKGIKNPKDTNSPAVAPQL